MKRFWSGLIGMLLSLPLVAQNIPDHLLDYSFCGYKNSNEPIPDVDNVIFVPWKEGCQSQRIQQAIDYVSMLPMNENGHRGAVLLDEGVFELSTPLRITTSGVVLRGVDCIQTILLKKGVDRGALLYIEGNDDIIPIDTLQITSDYLPLNSLIVEASDASVLQVGDHIRLVRPSTKDWIASLSCDTHGGGHEYWGWKPGDIDMEWDRIVIEKDNNQLKLDAPLSMALNADECNSIIIPYLWEGRISESGVENLMIVSDYDRAYPNDEDHCWTGVSIANADNCWVRHINFKHLAGSAVIIQPSGSRITIENCISSNPVSEIGGMRRSTYHTLGQLTLFQNCLSIHGIHDFSAGYCAPGPNAFVQCEAWEPHDFSGSIGSWACGLLFDIVNIIGNDIRLMNLGPSKNGVGWNTVNSTIWQSSASTIYCFSPTKDAKNYIYGSWGQCWGNGEWHDMDTHIKPRSLFYAQLKQRLGRERDNQPYIMPLSTNASTSPTAEVATNMAQASFEPRYTLEELIMSSAFTASVSSDSLSVVDDLILPINRKKTIDNYKQNICILDNTQSVTWWGGKLRKKQLINAKPHITRFVPDREGLGLTDNIDEVIHYLVENKINVLEHNYGLWYDRRRDDHARVRRSDGDVWAPFYEQPFARSGKGKAWDGLSLYDLNRPNRWYWYRLREFAKKAEKYNVYLYHNHYFQHNILEAGAHWVDSPWRTTNNINQTDFPEPVPFAGDKRVFMSHLFYDISHPIRRKIHENYIRMCLNELADCPQVIHLVSAEYTGPLHFVQFWLDVIADWEKETGKECNVALSTTKDVQDAILNDTNRSQVVDIIDIRYWHYHTDGLYAPQGGQNLSPRQHARQQQEGTVTHIEVEKALNEYRNKYPDKIVVYHGKAPVDISQ